MSSKLRFDLQWDLIVLLGSLCGGVGVWVICFAAAVVVGFLGFFPSKSVPQVTFWSCFS